MENSNNPMLKALTDTGSAFYKILHERGFVPSHNGNGFTERNITFNLCRCYSLNNPEAIIWQEMPILTGNNQHIDSIIIEENGNTLDIYYVEAKRLYNDKYVVGHAQQSLATDYSRFDICQNTLFTRLFPGLYKFIGERTIVRQHIVLIAGIEHKKDTDPRKINDSSKSFYDFSQANQMEFYHYDVKNRVLDKNSQIQEDYCQDNVLCSERFDTIYINYHLYLMMKSVQ